MVRDQLRRMALVGGEGLSLLWRYGWVVVIDEGGASDRPGSCQAGSLVAGVFWWANFFPRQVRVGAVVAASVSSNET
jgi:hypothetical protein